MMINKALIFVCILMIAASCDSGTKTGATTTSTASNAVEATGNTNTAQKATAQNTTKQTKSEILAAKKQNDEANTAIAQPSAPPKRVAGKTAQEAGVFDSEVPDACTLITEAEVAAIVGVNPSIVTLKDGSNKLTATTRSCFFRWSDSSSPNSGVLIQVQKNPIPEEYEDWPILFIESKIKNGEQTFDGTDVTYEYKAWDAVGDAGCYSYEASKYHWRLSNQYVFMVAFNTGANERNQMKQATALAKNVMASFNKIKG